MLLENLEFFSKKAFDTDNQLLAELVERKDAQGHPLGIVLISENSLCKSCGGKLHVRADRPNSLLLYTEDMGTVPGTLFRKYCCNNHKGCTLTQHYGFHSFNDHETAESVADSNWAELPFLYQPIKLGFLCHSFKNLMLSYCLDRCRTNRKVTIINTTRWRKRCQVTMQR